MHYVRWIGILLVSGVLACGLTGPVEEMDSDQGGDEALTGTPTPTPSPSPSPIPSPLPEPLVLEWWDGFESEGLNHQVLAMEVFDGKLIVGGVFSKAGSLDVNNIAAWDGSAWSTLGSGLDGPVRSLGTFDEGNGPVLFVGGGFTNTGDGATDVRQVAKWDGENWSSIGSELSSSQIESFHTFNNELMIGGTFSENINGTFARGLARWTGTEWNLFDPPMAEEVIGAVDVETMMTFQEKLIIGGKFTVQSGCCKSVYEWNGMDWTRIGTFGGDGDRVNAMVIFQDQLVVAGFFETIFGAGLSRWNGNLWRPLEEGVDGQVQTLALYDDSTGQALYAGGGFEKSGELTLNGIGKWDGEEWSALGDGISSIPAGTGNVLAIQEYDGYLYVGGNFNKAGDQTSLFIGRWGPADPTQ